MTFQRLAGWALEVNGDRRNARQDVVIGANGKRFTGRPKKDNRGFEASIDEEICFTAPCCADTLESLFEGMGYYFPFITDVWSTRSGLGPELSSSWTLVSGDGPASTRFHSVTAAGSGLLYNPELIDQTTAPDGGRWSVMYWVKDGSVWTHKVVRSDGSGLVDGVFTATITASELTVSQGGVLFAAGTQLASLAILPFWVCDDAGTAFYEWETAWDLGGYWRLDRSALDLTGQLNGTISGSPNVAAGQVKTGLRFAASPDYVNVGGATELSISTNQALTIEAWIAPDTAGGNNDGGIVCKYAAGAGFLFQCGTATTAGKVALDFIVEGSVAPSTWTLDDAVDVGEFSYVCVTWDGSQTGRAQAEIRINNATATEWTSYTPGASLGFPSDTALDVIIGNRSAADTTRFFDGIINEVRYSTSVLDAEVIRERWVAGRNRRGVPTPQQFAGLPALPLWGEFSGWRLHDFLGEVRSEQFEPYSENGTRVMARRIGVQFESVDMETGSLLPAPDFGINPTDERRTSLTSANLRATRGDFSWNGAGGLAASDYGKPGPFDWPNQAVSLSGGAYLRNTSQNIPRQFYGRGAVTVMMWVRRTLTGTVETLFETTDTATPDLRLLLQFLVNDRVAMSFRPTTGTVFQSTTGSPAVEITDTDWHLVGAIADPANNTGELIVDGRVRYTQSMPFAADEFSDEFNPLSTIGANASGLQPFTGDVGAWGLWLRRLSAGEILTVYEKAKRGLFR
jgi:hypothetical protein